MFSRKSILLTLLLALLSVTAWGQHTLQLQGVTVRDAVDEIQKRFGYSVVIRSSVSKIDFLLNIRSYLSERKIVSPSLLIFM